MLAEITPVVLISIVSRWVHILAAITAVGGTIFMRQVLLPSASSLPDDQHDALREHIRARWSMLLHTCIALLLVTGFYNFYVNGILAKPPPGPYHGIFFLKFLLAIVVFFLAIALTGRSDAFASLRAQRGKWLGVVIVLAIVIVLCSSVLRYVPVLFGGGGAEAVDAG